MEAIYLRYVGIVHQFGGSPVDLHMFALHYLGHFLEWERRSRIYELPLGRPGQSYFGLYLRIRRSAKSDDDAWTRYRTQLAMIQQRARDHVDEFFDSLVKRGVNHA